MLSLQFVRENPQLVRNALRDRGSEESVLDEMLRLDAERREVLVESEALRAERNELGKRIGSVTNLRDAAKEYFERDNPERKRLIDKMREKSERIDALEPRLKEAEERTRALLLELPNIPHPDTPIGAGEEENVVIRTEERRPFELDFEPRPHWEIGERLGIIDFERGVKLSGSRFYVLKGAGARLERALIAWMLDLHVEAQGYTEIYPPFVVKEECLWGAGQLPKFRDNLYHDVEDDLWLVPTAEVPLTNLHRDEILEPGALPLHYVAYTPCFRREKMSAGRDVRGIKRGHQFDKVEMYKLCAPEKSDAELERLLGDAEDTCRRLGLAHRVKALCTGDLGFSAAKAYDVEVWAPGCGEWLEVSTCSTCGDFQARRTGLRFRRERGAKAEYVHTLNGSGLGLPRTLAAVLESYQQRDGSVVVPEALKQYMGGVDVIGPAG
ncbi:MAG: serine--tRNA ligase [Dehalococcoidia bacterium]